jgi:hypothetical protein
MHFCKYNTCHVRFFLGLVYAYEYFYMFYSLGFPAFLFKYPLAVSDFLSTPKFTSLYNFVFIT